MFLHREGLEFESLKTKNVNGKRHYDTPGGMYPSVTTITSQVGKEAIKQWPLTFDVFFGRRICAFLQNVQLRTVIRLTVKIYPHWS